MAVLRDTSAVPNRGTATIPAGSASVDVTLPTTLLDTTKALLIWTYRGDGPLDRPLEGTVTGEIISTTTLRFQRYGTTGTPAVSIAWQVIEWTSGVTVQRGSTAVSVNTDTTDVAITAVDTTKAFVVNTFRNDGSTYGNDDWVSARLLDADTLRFERPLGGGTSSTGIACWQVVAYDACTVQAGVATIPAMSLSTTVGGSGFAGGWLLSSNHCGSGTTTDIGQKLPRGVVTNDTTLTFDRDHIGVSMIALTIPWFLVQFTDGTTVQTGGEAFASGVGSAVEAVASVAAWRAVAHASGMSQSGGITDLMLDDDPAPALFTCELGSGDTTALTLTRRAATQTAAVQWFVVEFDDGAGGDAAITADAAVLTLAGQDATTGTGSAVAADAATLALAGQDAALATGVAITADAGSVAVDGQSAAVAAAAAITASAAALTLGGETATVNSTEGDATIAATAAALALGQTSAVLAGGATINTTTGQITLAGDSVTVTFGSGIVADAGTVALDGQAATLAFGAGINATAGVLALAGVAATVGEFDPSLFLAFATPRPLHAFAAPKPVPAFAAAKPIAAFDAPRPGSEG